MIRTYRNRRNKDKNTTTITTITATTATATATTILASAITCAYAIAGFGADVSSYVLHETLSSLREVRRTKTGNQSCERVQNKDRYEWMKHVGSLVSLSILSYRLRLPDSAFYSCGSWFDSLVSLSCSTSVMMLGAMQHTLFVSLNQILYDYNLN